jgi:hypothetical protein
MSRIICPLYLGQAENMEWLVMDAEIHVIETISFVVLQNSFLIYLSCEYDMQMLPTHSYRVTNCIIIDDFDTGG